MCIDLCCLCSLNNKRSYSSRFNKSIFFLLLPARRKQLVDTASVPGVTPLSLRWDRHMSSYPFKKRSLLFWVLLQRDMWLLSFFIPPHGADLEPCLLRKQWLLSKSLFVFLWANSTTWALSESVCSTMLDNGQIDDGCWTKLHHTPVHCSCFSYPLHKSLHRMTFGSAARLENSLKNSPL